MEVIRVEKDTALWTELTAYAQDCPWVVGTHLAGMLRENKLEDWESVFAVLQEGKIIGYCTFLRTDYYPENRYSPWISSIFVDEDHRGRRVSGAMIEKVIEYARTLGFARVYIPSDIVGMYEKYGFVRIDELVNYGGDVDQIFARDIV